VISIVDDDRSVRSATNRLVRSLGFIAHTFASADEFLTSSYIDQTSCLIVDIRMPLMNGLELQSALLAKGVRIPMIFITAFPEDDARMQAMAAGAVDFLTKPFDRKTIIKALAAALKGQNDVADELLLETAPALSRSER
jgi:FixJ family two-component response regulator